jgi:uncharacterized protein YecE (DUF72 family)
MHLFLGCPVWSFKGWVGNFYPQGAKPGEYLREYSRRLTTVEGNTTFYAVPPRKTLHAWAEEMPEGFRFCPKLPRAISHQGTLTRHIEEARSFMEVMRQLGTRLGPAFLQLPPRFSPRQFDDLRTFLGAWQGEHRLAVEVRHLDWYGEPHTAALDELLGAHGMARVTIDTRPIRDLDGDRALAGTVYQSLLEARARKPDVPVNPARTADFVFVRFIGHPVVDHNQPYLEEWAQIVASELRAGADAYVFCHTPDTLFAPFLCRELHRRVAALIPLPTLPWEEADAGTLSQGRLF